MNKIQAVNNIVENIKENFEGKYIVDVTPKNKIKLRDLNNPDLVLYTIELRTDWLTNFVEVALYNGHLTKQHLTYNFFDFKKENANFDLLK